MRTFHLLVLTVGLSRAVNGQINVGVWTDKPVYKYGDTVTVTVTAYNPTTDTLKLYFPSLCQANFIIDSFNFYRNIGCADATSMLRIPPLSVRIWLPFKYPMYHSGWPGLNPGTHTVVGEVLNYARSDTLLFTVTPTTGIQELEARSLSVSLGVAYPNPFNGATTIPFTLSHSDRVSISIYSSIGRKVRVLLDETLPQGSHNVRAELNDLASGIYWCCLQVGGKRQTQRLVLAK